MEFTWIEWANYVCNVTNKCVSLVLCTDFTIWLLVSKFKRPKCVRERAVALTKRKYNSDTINGSQTTSTEYSTEHCKEKFLCWTAISRSNVIRSLWQTRSALHFAFSHSVGLCAHTSPVCGKINVSIWRLVRKLYFQVVAAHIYRNVPRIRASTVFHSKIDNETNFFLLSFTLPVVQLLWRSNKFDIRRLWGWNLGGNNKLIRKQYYSRKVA